MTGNNDLTCTVEICRSDNLTLGSILTDLDQQIGLNPHHGSHGADTNQYPVALRPDLVNLDRPFNFARHVRGRTEP